MRSTLVLGLLIGGVTVHADAQSPVKPDTARTEVFAYPLAEDTSKHSWYVSQYLGRDLGVRVMNVATPGECVLRDVAFVHMNASTANVPTLGLATARAYWDREKDYCRATVRWRLGDAPGAQSVQARIIVPADGKHIVPDSVARKRPAMFHASAHPLPGIIVGMAWLNSTVRGVTMSDSASRERAQRRAQPLIGIDFPLVGAFVSPDLARRLDNIRIMTATSFGDPGRDLYLGVEIFPLLGQGPRAAAVPLQLSAGHKFGLTVEDNWFIAGHANIGSAINAVLGGLGVK